MTKWSEQLPNTDYFQLLTPDGELNGDLPDLPEETLLEMYRSFVQTRVYENKIMKLQRRGELSIINRTLGEEATGLGTLAALDPGDWCFTGYRQAAGLFYWDYPLELPIASLMGYEPETIDKHLEMDWESPINFTPTYVPLAANIPNAAGSAMYDSFNQNETVTLTHIGEGATSEGAFYEGMNFAGVFEPPLVVICQNNQWAISVPARRQSGSDTFAQKAEAFGIPHDRVDGNDLFAVYKKTREAVERARKGGGPTFIECVTYRRGEHNTADDPGVYRSDEVQEFWEERDPVERFEAYLRSENLVDDGTIQDLEQEMRERVDQAIETVRNLPTSEPSQMFDNHIRTQSWNERHQREELGAELRGDNPFVDFNGEGL